MNTYNWLNDPVRRSLGAGELDDELLAMFAAKCREWGFDGEDRPEMTVTPDKRLAYYARPDGYVEMGLNDGHVKVSIGIDECGLGAELRDMVAWERWWTNMVGGVAALRGVGADHFRRYGQL
jgi:hypothetical protein